MSAERSDLVVHGGVSRSLGDALVLILRSADKTPDMVIECLRILEKDRGHPRLRPEDESMLGRMETRLKSPTPSFSPAERSLIRHAHQTLTGH